MTSLLNPMRCPVGHSIEEFAGPDGEGVYRKDPRTASFTNLAPGHPTFDNSWGPDGSALPWVCSQLIHVYPELRVPLSAWHVIRPRCSARRNSSSTRKSSGRGATTPGLTTTRPATSARPKRPGAIGRARQWTLWRTRWCIRHRFRHSSSTRLCGWPHRASHLPPRPSSTTPCSRGRQRRQAVLGFLNTRPPISQFPNLASSFVIVR